jgi:hypothetical protein
MEFKTEYPDDVFMGEKNHPQCCFFELFPSSPDPNETFYGEKFCHMTVREKEALVCKGDYLECPLAYGQTDLDELLALFKRNKQ